VHVFLQKLSSFEILWASLSASDFALQATTGQDDPTSRACRFYRICCVMRHLQ